MAGMEVAGDGAAAGGGAASADRGLGYSINVGEALRRLHRV